jgi:hypothetical protein
MEYLVDCPCGKAITVGVAQAGTEIACSCGARVQVPRLSALRERAGQGAYESGTIDTIRRMIAEGTLPWGVACAVSRRPTGDVIELNVQCERLYHRGGGRGKSLLLLLSPLLYLVEARREADGELVGRDTTVRVPLRVAGDFHRDLARRASQRRLRRLLRSVPIYARLLDEYPRATVTVGESYADDRWKPKAPEPEL